MLLTAMCATTNFSPYYVMVSQIAVTDLLLLLWDPYSHMTLSSGKWQINCADRLQVWMHLFFSYLLYQGGYVFGPVLSGCQQDYRKNYWPGFHETRWNSVACTKEEAITSWCGSESRGRYNNYFSLLLPLRYRAFGLGGINAMHLKIK